MISGLVNLNLLHFTPPSRSWSSSAVRSCSRVARVTATSKNPRWGRSRTNNVKKREWIQAEKARSEEPLRRAPMLMSGSIDLRHSPERPDKAGTQMTGRASVRRGFARPFLGRFGKAPVFKLAARGAHSRAGTKYVISLDTKN